MTSQIEFDFTSPGGLSGPSADHARGGPSGQSPPSPYSDPETELPG